MSDLNQTAVRNHALNCSKTLKNGKFTRVGEEFLIELEADVEAVVRSIRIRFPTAALSLDCDNFLTPVLREKILREFNELIGRIIQNKVQQMPTVGKTLGRTR